MIISRNLIKYDRCWFFCLEEAEICFISWVNHLLPGLGFEKYNAVEVLVQIPVVCVPFSVFIHPEHDSEENGNTLEQRYSAKFGEIKRIAKPTSARMTLFPHLETSDLATNAKSSPVVKED